MIEMRWVWHNLKKGSPPIGSVNVGQNLYQKLQYRYKLQELSADIGSYPSSSGIWSEWIDVQHSGEVV